MMHKAETVLSAHGETKIETSAHAASGLITCAREGCICWRGAIERLPADIVFDAVYCHEDDAETMRRVLAAGREPARAFASVDSGSREENPSNEDSRAGSVNRISPNRSGKR